MDEALTVRKQHIYDILLSWEEETRAGKTQPLSEVLKKPAGEVAQESADHFWVELQKVCA